MFHFYSFSAMELASEVTLPEMVVEVTVLLLSCCGTVLANIMVLVNVTIKEKLHAPTYFYYLSLAVSDLILGKNTLITIFVLLCLLRLVYTGNSVFVALKLQPAGISSQF